MRQELVVGDRVPSENELRHGHRFALATRTKKVRLGIAEALSANLDRGELPAVVELTRISPGYLDDDNLRGAFKAHRDGVADWLGIDDRDDRVQWRYAQRGCPLREAAFSVAIEFTGSGVDRRVVLAGVPAAMGAAVEATSKRRADDVPRSLRGATTQLKLPTAPTYVILPWDGNGRTMKRIALGTEPPERIAIVVPVSALRSAWGARARAGSRVEMVRRTRRRKSGETVYVYEQETKR